MSIDAMKQALEFLYRVRAWTEGKPDLHTIKENLTAAIEAAEKVEPVARYFEQYQGQPIEEIDEDRYNATPEDCRFKLYTTPQPALRAAIEAAEKVDAYKAMLVAAPEIPK